MSTGPSPVVSTMTRLFVMKSGTKSLDLLRGDLNRGHPTTKHKCVILYTEIARKEQHAETY